MISIGFAGIAAFGLVSGLLAGCLAVFLLRRRHVLRHAASQFTTRFMYSGNLNQTNLLDAIQFLELGGREGILHIYAGRRKGYITFLGGKIVDAFFRNTTGTEAIFQMLELTYGDFSFESKSINQPRVITESIMNIALEWDARRYGSAYAGDEAQTRYDEVPGGEDLTAREQPQHPLSEGLLPDDETAFAPPPFDPDARSGLLDTTIGPVPDSSNPRSDDP